MSECDGAREIRPDLPARGNGMSAEEFARKVKNMRYAQQEYFKHRDHAALVLSKRLEKEVDAAADEILGAAAYAAGGQEWADWNAGMLDFGD